MINPYALSGVLSVLVHILVIGCATYVRVHTAAVPMLLANTVFLMRDVAKPAAVVVKPAPPLVPVPVSVPARVDLHAIVLRPVPHSPPHLPQQRQRPSIERQRLQRQWLQREIAQEPNHQRSEKSQRGSQDSLLYVQYQQVLIAHIRRFVLISFDLSSHNPVVFDVTQSHDGHVIAVRLRHSSGHVAYDRAVERAIRLASPLPRPTAGRFFETHLVIRFYPS